MKAARVVVLTVAIAAGGVAALLAGRSGNPPEVKVEAPKFNTVDILVAKSDISRGQTLTPAEVAWEAWPATTASGNFIRKSDRPKALQDLSGMIVRAPFVAGEPIREVKLVNAKGSGFMAAILPAGMRAISTQISAETGAGGFILPNDRVDVILTPRGGNRDAEKGGGASETILRNVRVLAIDQTIEEKNGLKVVVGKPLRSNSRQAKPRLWRCLNSSACCRWRCAALLTRLMIRKRTRRIHVATSMSSGLAYPPRPHRDDQLGD
jgi:pilus assembly protein CpaB